MKRVIIIDDMFYDIDLISHNTNAIYEVNDNYEVVEKNAETIDEVPYLSHADICAKVIKKYCVNVNFINIVIKDSFMRGDINKLISAIEYACQMNSDVVHMSVGTNKFYHVHQLHRAIKTLSSQTKVVAAKANNGKKTFPADFLEVTGCRINAGDEIQRLPKNNYALPGAHLIRGKDGIPFYTSSSNSFAAAYYTGLYCSGKI